jgi:hypothetical protein
MQRAIWIITFLIILAVSYYWLVIHEESEIRTQIIEEVNFDQDGSINTVTEKENRLELKYKGHGKHLQQTRSQVEANYAEYTTRVDSIDIIFEEVKFEIEQLDERLVRKIDRLQTEVNNLLDDFERNKRKTNRSIRDIQNNISTMQDDIKKIEEYMPIIKQKLKLDKDKEQDKK